MILQTTSPDSILSCPYIMDCLLKVLQRLLEYRIFVGQVFEFTLTRTPRRSSRSPDMPGPISLCHQGRATSIHRIADKMASRNFSLRRTRFSYTEHRSGRIPLQERARLLYAFSTTSLQILDTGLLRWCHRLNRTGRAMRISRYAS